MNSKIFPLLISWAKTVNMCLYEFYLSAKKEKKKKGPRVQNAPEKQKRAQGFSEKKKQKETAVNRVKYAA